MAELHPKQDQAIAVDQQKTEPENEYLKLRKLLLGPDYEKAIHDYISREDDVERVADVLSEAIKICTKDDPALGRSLAPVLNKAIHESITNNPTQITNAISPIMGPAIRKAVSDALLDMVQSLNRVLEQSLSVQGLSWRYKAWRAGVSYGRYVMSQTLRFSVEQVLLVHKETGLLLHSVVDEQTKAQDPELVSSMLTAIQDFVSDSFETETESRLDRVQMGDLTLHLIAGPYSVLAIAVRGTISNTALDSISNSYESIQRRYASEMEAFEGDRDIFLTTEDELRSCLLSEKIEPETVQKKSPWLAITVLALLAIYAAYEGYWSYQLEQERERIVGALSSEKGYVLVSQSEDDLTIRAQMLRSPDALDLESLLEKIKPQHFGVELDSQDVTFGRIDLDKLNALVMPEAPKPLSTIEQYQALAAEINSYTLFFEENSSALLVGSEVQITELVNKLKRLVPLAEALNPGKLQILVMGFADQHGSRYGNLTISQQRAELVRSILVENGLAEASIVAWGLGHKDRVLEDEAIQRRVALNVILPGYERTSEIPNDIQQAEE